MEELPEERPPLFSTWSSWYVLVIGFLLFLIVIFAWFTKHYS